MYCKNPKISDTRKIAVITLIFEHDGDGMANSIDPDQTAPLAAV